MLVKAATLRRTAVGAPYAETGPLEIGEVELAPPGPGEVLVAIKAAGLCHSDLSVINGDRPRPLPMILGHEAAGVVEAVGAGVHDLAPGDHVVTVFMPNCGHCLPCADGRPALCEPGALANGAGVLSSGESRLSHDGEMLHHHLGVSAFAERAVVSRRSVVPVPADIPMVVAALFGCAVLTGVGAVVNTARLTMGSSAAVVGLGGVGLAAVLGARAAGAGRIVAVDLSDEKLALARDLGATDTVNAADPDCVDQVRAATGGGADFAFEMAGSIRALQGAVEMTRRGGMTVTAGLPPAGSALPVDIVRLVGEERTLKGSYMGSCVPSRDIPRYIELYREGRLPVERLLSGTLTLEQINEGFDRLHHGQAVRQVVVF
ncbi:MAG: zinc-dependent alcohol dehydrogenase family protein [Proteobacteria bacterium]|nr:zinc-dependent alcohol dehydrogenase family protein [Pseudomonadota bacterium]